MAKRKINKTYFRLICRNLVLSVLKSGLSCGSSDQHLSIKDVISSTCSLTFSLEIVGLNGVPLSSGPFRTASTISAIQFSAYSYGDEFQRYFQERKLVY